MILLQLNQIVAAAAAELGWEGAQPELQYAPTGKGDFTTNLAFRQAKRAGQAPAELAKALATAIKGAPIEQAQAAGGYVNLTLGDEFWAKQLENLDVEPVDKPQRVQVEFISANPTGPLTLANARGGYLGDVYANVLSTLGHQVTREYYLNDTGTQISKLIQSIKAEAGGDAPEERQYTGQYVAELATELKVQLDLPDSELAAKVVSYIVEHYIQPAVERMGVKFDQWFKESSLEAGKYIQQAEDKLGQQDLMFEKDGATWVKTEWDAGRPERVLKKSDGSRSYLFNDIAYHLEIAQRGFERAVKVWGADHAGQVQSLKHLVEKLTDLKLEFCVIQLVRLMQGGQELKVSKRAGTYVTVDELLEQIDSDVARFFFLMRSHDSAMDFDLDLARERTQKNPYHYVMYSYVRAGSLLAKAKAANLEVAQRTTKLSPPERELIRQMSRWNNLLHEIAGDYAVHKLTFYGAELAKGFHDYYEQEKIIDLAPETAGQKLYFVQRYRQFMKAYFKVLGITPIEKM